MDSMDLSNGLGQSFDGNGVVWGTNFEDLG